MKFSILSRYTFIFAVGTLTIASQIGCRSKTIVKRLGKSETKVETTALRGALYHLPLTVVNATVPMTVEIATPGKYSAVAPCYFDPEDAENRITEKKKSYSVGVPTFASHGIADLDETYVVQTTGGYFESRTVAMTLDTEGNLTEGSVDSKDEALPIAIKVGETAVGIAAKALTIGALGGGADAPPEEIVQGLLFSKKREIEDTCAVRGIKFHLQRLNQRILEENEKIDQTRDPKEIEQHRILSSQLQDQEKDERKKDEKLVQEIQDIREYLTKADPTRPLPIGTKPFAQYLFYLDAEKAFENLKALEGKRIRIEDTLANVNPELYKSRVAELDAEITRIKGLFLGTTETYKWSGTFEFQPHKDTNGVDDSTLLTYGDSTGVCINDPFNSVLKKQDIIVDEKFQATCSKTATGLTRIQIYADREPDSSVFVNRVSNAVLATHGDVNSWYFRIPAKATVGVLKCAYMAGNTRCASDSEETARSSFLIAQYGQVVSLPAKNAGRNSSSSVTLDPTTGALKNFKVSTSPAIDKSIIDDAGKTVQGALDSADPLTRKKRELDLLKTQNDINEQKKKLEATPTPTPGGSEP